MTGPLSRGRLSGAPFVAEHVKRACLVMGSIADEFGGMLQKEFGGRRAFEEETEGAGVL